MKIIKLFLIVLITCSSAQAQDASALVSAFKGSELLGTYEARFAPLTLLCPPMKDRNIPSSMQVVGKLESRLYTRPEDVSEFEVYSSYKKVLSSAHFDIILDCDGAACNAKDGVKQAYWNPSKEIVDRDYGKLPTSSTEYLTGWAKYYISAKKKTADKTYHVMIIISTQRQYYSVDVMESANMEEGSVELSPDLLRAKIKDDGKAVLDGIFFGTGKDVITPNSAAALDAIASFLKSDAGTSYYVVGHTDDVGDLESNLSLSAGRATAVVAALTSRGISASRLTAKGVGPLSPAASNQSDPGKAKNRRVELVLMLR